MSDVLREEPALDVDTLRQAIQEEYAEVASHPQKGFHFHTGRPLALKLNTLTSGSRASPKRASSPSLVPATPSAWASCTLVSGSWT